MFLRTSLPDHCRKVEWAHSAEFLNNLRVWEFTIDKRERREILNDFSLSKEHFNSILAH